MSASKGIWNPGTSRLDTLNWEEEKVVGLAREFGANFLV